MKLLIIPLSLCIFLLYGCLDAAENETKSHETSQYTITLQKGKLTIIDHPLLLPLPIDKITNNIGMYSRFIDKANDIYTWDEHGYKLWSRPNKKTIYQIGIYIRKKPKADYLNYVEDYIDSRPKQDFSGTFILDGVTLTQKITFERLNAKKTGNKFNRTHWADKFKYYSKNPETGQKYRVIVYLHEDRTINYVEIVYDEETDNTDIQKSGNLNNNKRTLPKNSLNAPFSTTQNELHEKDKLKATLKVYKEKYSFTDIQLSEFRKRYVTYEKKVQKNNREQLDSIASRFKNGEITEKQAEFEMFKYFYGISDDDLADHSKARTEIDKTKDERSETDTHLLNFAANTALLKNFGEQRANDIENIANLVKKSY